MIGRIVKTIKFKNIYMITYKLNLLGFELEYRRKIMR